jgi:hypothetical protein
MTIDRVLHNAGTVPLPVHEVRMLAVDAGGVFFGKAPPSNLRCVHAGGFRQTAQSAGPGSGPTVESLPVQDRILGGSAADSLPALAICDAGLTTFLLEAAMRQDPFSQTWQIKAREDWQPGRSVLSDYAAISRDPRREPLQLSPDQRQAVSSLYYQVKANGGLRCLYDDCHTEQTRRHDQA